MKVTPEIFAWFNKLNIISPDDSKYEQLRKYNIIPDNIISSMFLGKYFDILIEPLLDLYKYKYESNSPYEEYMNDRYEKYKTIFEEIKKRRSEYEQKQIQQQKDIEYLDDEFLCSICYSKISNYNIIPCFHKGCKECLLAYLAENDKCFMCRQPYDSVVKIPDEEIKKILEKAKETNKGEEIESKSE